MSDLEQIFLSNEQIVTKGVCSKCKEIMSTRAAKSHIAKCLNQGIEDSSDAFLIKVQWPHKNPIYWLYLSVPFKSKLEDLDHFLRKIWLECCGHLSQFTIDHKRYSSYFEPNSFSPSDYFGWAYHCNQISTGWNTFKYSAIGIATIHTLSLYSEK